MTKPWRLLMNVPVLLLLAAADLGGGATSALKV
jgi:hypothetical protein